jgi:hypothetical protein
MVKKLSPKQNPKKENLTKFDSNSSLEANQQITV